MSIKPILLLLLFAPALSAQEFKPPKDEDTVPSSIKVGLTGFSSRAGLDFKGGTQLISSFAFDIADLYSPRVRVRPSGEIGVGSGDGRSEERRAGKECRSRWS